MASTFVQAPIALVLVTTVAASASMYDHTAKLRGGGRLVAHAHLFGRDLQAPHPRHSGGGSNNGNGNGGGSHGSGGGSYNGCLQYTSEELEEMWGIGGTPSECSYAHTGGNSYEDDDATEHQYDTSEDNSGSYGDAAATEDDDDTYGDGSQGEFDIVVTNEDFINGTEYDAYEDFDISQCSTYSNLWTWDLALTCESTKSLDGCNCTFAENLLSDGLLQCDDGSQCPDDCPVCRTCLTVIGCNVNDAPDRFRAPNDSVSTAMILYIISAVLLLLVLVALAHRRRRKPAKGSGDMTKNLIAGEETVQGGYIAGLTSTTPTWEPLSIGSNVESEDDRSAMSAAENGFVGAETGAAIGLAAGALYAAKASNNTAKEHSDDVSSDGESNDDTAPTMDESTIASNIDRKVQALSSLKYGIVAAAIAEDEDSTSDDEGDATPFEEDLEDMEDADSSVGLPKTRANPFKEENDTALGLRDESVLSSQEENGSLSSTPHGTHLAASQDVDLQSEEEEDEENVFNPSFDETEIGSKVEEDIAEPDEEEAESKEMSPFEEDLLREAEEELAQELASIEGFDDEAAKNILSDTGDFALD